MGALAFSPCGSPEKAQTRLPPAPSTHVGDLWHRQYELSEPSRQLLAAARAGDLFRVEKQLGNLGRPNCCNAAGLTPLHAATELGRADIVKILILHNADVDAPPGPDFDGPPIALASHRGLLECIEVLLEAKADAEATSNPSDSTCVHRAAAEGHTRCLKALLAAHHHTAKAQGLDHSRRSRMHDHHRLIANIPDSNEQLPLHRAAAPGHFECVDVLIREGFSWLNEKDFEGRAALHLGVLTHNEDNAAAIAHSILDAQGQVDIRNDSGCTALHLVAHQGRAQVTEVLLRHAASVHAVESMRSRTPLHVAARAGARDVCIQLLAAHADVKAESRDARGTALMCADPSCQELHISESTAACSSEMTETSRPDSRPFVVVLTGGPCAGKSSAMAFLRDRLSKRGFQVLTVPENATHFLTNSEGFQPEWAGTAAQVSMQRIFMEYQISQEDAFKAFGKLHPSKRSILLLDCCTLNSKVYLSDEQWKQVLSLPGHAEITEQQLFARYDLVIHMVSCAFDGLYEWGPGSNNPGRYHSPDQAKECDKRSLDVFANHPQVRVVPHFPSFDGKMQQVLHFLNDALHIDGLTGKRRRQQVRIKDFDRLLDIAAQASTTSFVVASTFLDEQMEKSLRRRATVPNKVWVDNFRKLEATIPLSKTESFDDIEALRDGHDVVYEQRSHMYVRVSSNSDEETGYLTRRLIKAEDYYAAESVASDKKSTVKFVLGFLIDHQYYELFFFPCYKAPILDMMDDMEHLPAWLELVEESEPLETDRQEVASSTPSKDDALITTPAKSTKVLSETPTPTPVRAGSSFEQPRAKRRRVLSRFSTEAAACQGSFTESA